PSLPAALPTSPTSKPPRPETGPLSRNNVTVAHVAGFFTSENTDSQVSSSGRGHVTPLIRDHLHARPHSPREWDEAIAQHGRQRLCVRRYGRSVVEHRAVRTHRPGRSAGADGLPERSRGLLRHGRGTAAARRSQKWCPGTAR